MKKHDFRRQDETLKKILNQFNAKSELSTFAQNIDFLFNESC